jgi:hypothetical protein
MSLLRSIGSGIRSLFRKEQVSHELDEELNGFLEMAAEEKMKQGMSRKDALRAVRLERGNLDGAKEVVRSAGWESFVETLWQDLRFSLRMLHKSPGFTAVAVLTLALGIGANTAIFSLTYAVILKSLPVPNPDELVRYSFSESGLSDLSISGPAYDALRKHETVDQDILAWSGAPSDSSRERQRNGRARRADHREWLSRPGACAVHRADVW